MPTILIVEDNDMNRDMLARRLMRRGYDVLVAADGQQGVTAARESRPDLVLMDLGLPVMDGWEATRRIKGDVDISMIPVVALTAHAMAGDEQRAFDAGCDAFDTKPVDLDRLLGTIESLLARRGVA
jgi:two-component system cell cycle response regulator DivK